MNPSCKVALLLLALLGTSLPSPAFAQAQAVETKPFLAAPGESIKTIGLLTIDEPWGYFLGEGGVSSFGIAGLLASTFKRPKHPEYERAGFRFSDRAERVLTEHLKAAGFNVISVPVKRKKSFQLLRNYKTLSAANVDAYLDVVSGGVGYRQNDSAPDFAQKVGPYVMIAVQLVSARSKEILYADTIEYAWRKAHRTGLPGSEINAPDEQIFADAESVKMDLLGGQGSRSLAQLTQGIDIAMRKIVSEFGAYPETGPALQAGAAPASPTEVAKAAPAEIAITGWRQKAVTDFQPLIGKWEGSGLTAKRKAFDLEITYRTDGTYTFRANRGTPGSASYRGMRIAGGVYEGKSYTTGDPVTIAVYEDEHGNHVLTALRADGLTWTVAKTKYALSSFRAAGGSKVRAAPMAPETGTTAKPAPGTTLSTKPLPGAALTGWRQKPITNFQIIVGKWEGFVLTPKGKKYDYEVTYGDDGTYAFRVERGMLRSGGGNRIADGVIKSKSYVTGNPMTIVLYEDERGNHVLKAQGADGHTSTVAKAEYALSSFLAAGGSKAKVAAMAPPTGTAPKTVPAAASPAMSAKVAPTKHSEVRSSQTTSSAAPFEGITLAPGGSVQAINAAAVAYCGSLNKKSKLVAAPPNNPNYVFQCYQPTKAASAATPLSEKIVAKAAPEIDKRAAFTPYKIAIFPFESDTDCIGRVSRPSHEQFAAQLGTHIKNNDSLTLAYSYYDKEHNQPPIKRPGRLWKGSKPNMTEVTSLGKTYGVDAVVMYWRATANVGYSSSCTNELPPFYTDVYVIDVGQRKTYAQNGSEADLNALTEQVLSRFISGRR